MGSGSVPGTSILQFKAQPVPYAVPHAQLPWMNSNRAQQHQERTHGTHLLLSARMVQQTSALAGLMVATATVAQFQTGPQFHSIALRAVGHAPQGRAHHQPAHRAHHQAHHQPAQQAAHQAHLHQQTLTQTAQVTYPSTVVMHAVSVVNNQLKPSAQWDVLKSSRNLRVTLKATDQAT